MANALRRNDSLDKIKINGVWLNEDQESLNAQEAEFLEVPFSEEEIHSALLELNGDKAPGPNGFTVAFWQACWDFMKRKFWRCSRSPYRLLLKHQGLRQGDSLLLTFCVGNGSAKCTFKKGCGWGVHFRKENLTFLSWILAWFEATSGLRINLAKSELIPVGKVEEIEEMAVKLGCRVGSLPTVYLGLPLGAYHKTPSMWDGVDERMRRRLALWKRQYISKGGRITLIKSTLASMPIYQLSLFRMPKIVAKRWKNYKETSFGEGEAWKGEST
ncbi:hypothetical protein CK203_093146 [Vitis vinifera]|uniref:Reverse transcriptase zinc-binding domain-containing protein n=1 Tax=Vitis vinifera TaxID=29760 RepID=A0A438D6Q8_VITVI|nr:hypothetical protein CK203_093146 [Vitis vinifera]